MLDDLPIWREYAAPLWREYAALTTALRTRAFFIALTIIFLADGGGVLSVNMTYSSLQKTVNC